MQQVYIIHGYRASPDSHWFPYLENELKQDGVVCHRLALPTPQTPEPQAWYQYLLDNIRLNEETVIVGHSLGCVTALNYLARRQQTVLGGIFVSGVIQPLPHFPELDPFMQTYAETLKLVNSAPHFKRTPYVIASSDDSVVPHQYSDQLAQHLQAVYIRLPRGGHFLDREGHTEFPLVLEKIKSLFRL
ncbi:alpha/beta hydrolase [Pasteurellaceae bacterium LIM206]|nr:alpha/beta hydrolase [Pasteurellaceae bacterium LIM206]